MAPAYRGPLRQERLAIELHNTLYAANGSLVDGLADAGDWLGALGARLPERAGDWPSAGDLVELRRAVRDALHAAVDRPAPERAALEVINTACARAPRSPIAIWRPDGDTVAATDYHGASRADVVLAAFAADTIDLLTGPHRADLRVCGAPGCVLMFLRDHPRREWCSNACGNRARQARHYQRARRRDPS